MTFLECMVQISRRILSSLVSMGLTLEFLEISCQKLSSSSLPFHNYVLLFSVKGKDRHTDSFLIQGHEQGDDYFFCNLLAADRHKYKCICQGATTFK